jgi:hypothetical protein
VPVTVSLEQAFMELTRDAVQYGATAGNATNPPSIERAA